MAADPVDLAIMYAVMAGPDDEVPRGNPKIYLEFTRAYMYVGSDDTSAASQDPQ